jgi:hypothetical protein
MGLRTLELGTRVYYTHRATTVGATGKGHTRYSGEARDLHKSDIWRSYYDKPGPFAEPYWHPSLGWPAPFRKSHGWRTTTSPVRMDRWVVVWPEAGVGFVVGLTYRAEGRVRQGGYDEPNEWDEWERYPLYEVRAHLVGRKVLVPPFACVPLDGKVATFGDNLPLVFGLDDEHQPERVGHLEWADYVEHRLSTDLGVRRKERAHA